MIYIPDNRPTWRQQIRQQQRFFGGCCCGNSDNYNPDDDGGYDNGTPWAFLCRNGLCVDPEGAGDDTHRYKWLVTIGGVTGELCECGSGAGALSPNGSSIVDCGTMDGTYTLGFYFGFAPGEAGDGFCRWRFESTVKQFNPANPNRPIETWSERIVTLTLRNSSFGGGVDGALSIDVQRNTLCNWGPPVGGTDQYYRNGFSKATYALDPFNPDFTECFDIFEADLSSVDDCSTDPLVEGVACDWPDTIEIQLIQEPE